MLDGILPVDKPAGWTSHDVVGYVRRVTGQRQIGHAGTLDPLATGVLVLVLGAATRLSSYLMQSAKIYQAEIVLGATSATDDAEAPLKSRTEITQLDEAAIASSLAHFRGPIAQVPPRYAAARYKAEKLYILARKGIDVEPVPRTVQIDQLTILYWRPPRLRLEIHCGSGTYVRSLARDIGAELAVGGYLHALRRTGSGNFSVRDCPSVPDISDVAAVRRALRPADHAILAWPALTLSDEEALLVRQGRNLVVEEGRHGNVRLYEFGGRLLALGRASSGAIKPFRVFSCG